MCKGDDGQLHVNLLCAVNVTEQPMGTLPDIESTDEALSFLKSRVDEDAPFFLAAGFHKPHIPFRIPQVQHFNREEFLFYVASEVSEVEKSGCISQGIEKTLRFGETLYELGRDAQLNPKFLKPGILYTVFFMSNFSLKNKW